METLKLIIGQDTIKEIQESVEKIKIHEGFSITAMTLNEDEKELERQVQNQVVLQDVITNHESEESII